MLAATKPLSDSETAEARLHRRYRAIDKLPAVQQLREYTGRLDGYNFVASEYTRAAVRFPSPDLVAGARRVGVPVASGMAFVRERGALGPVDAYLVERFGQYFDNRVQSPALREISLAVTDAALDPNAATITTAEGVIRAHDKRDFLTFLGQAYEGDSQACEAHDREAFRAYRERCEENTFENDALGFWFERSRLRLIAQKNGLPSTLPDQAARDDVVLATIALFQRRAWEQGWRYGEGLPSPQAFDLMLLRAEARTLDAAKVCRGESDDRIDHMPDILNDLIDAQTMISPARDPGRYRRLAEVYLTTYEVARRCNPEFRRDEYARNALLMRGYLASYDALVAVER